jgi:hypothetical protein
MERAALSRTYSGCTRHVARIDLLRARQITLPHNHTQAHTLPGPLHYLKDGKGLWMGLFFWKGIRQCVLK